MEAIRAFGKVWFVLSTTEKAVVVCFLVEVIAKFGGAVQEIFLRSALLGHGHFACRTLSRSNESRIQLLKSSHELEQQRIPGAYVLR